MRNLSAKPIALGGILAALSITLMCLGGLIPFFTYICPMLSTLICWLVLHFCGKRIAWTWYFAVSLLCTLIGPDKEAAAVFLLLGYYPIIKSRLDNAFAGKLLKILLFNSVIAGVYLLQSWIIGSEEPLQEFHGVGLLWLVLFLILGNITFFMLDKLLAILGSKR